MLVRQQEPRNTSTALNESDLVQQRKHKSTINLSSIRNISQKTVRAGLSLFTVFTFEETGTLPSRNSALRYEEIAPLRNVVGHPITRTHSYLYKVMAHVMNELLNLGIPACPFEYNRRE